MPKILNKKSGFTLIEIMVVLVILAILAAIIYPNYQAQARKSRRGEAMTNMLSIQANYEEANAQSNSYPASNTLSSGAPIPNTANYGYTTITTATTYVITATALNTSDQVNDTQSTDSCATMSIDNTGLQTPASCWTQ